MGKFKKHVVESITASITSMIRKIADDHGMRVEPVGIRYGDGKMFVEIELTGENRHGVDGAEAHFKKIAKHIGIDPNSFGRVFLGDFYGKQAKFRIVGIKAATNPILAKELKSGTAMLFPVEVAK